MRKTFIYFLVFFLISPLFPVLEASAASEPIMRVKLRNYLGNQKQITVVATGELKTSDGTITLQNGEEHKIAVNGSSLNLYKGTTLIKQFNTSFSIVPVSGGDILNINNRPYLGSFQFTIENGYVRPINSVPMEDYLRGVVPREMPASWHKEALKAQAISARTYAMSHSASVIDDTISYQVYGGQESNVNSNDAVNETTGQVLKYNGRLISAVFSASNGGVTESNANAWGSTQLPYFTVKTDTFDPASVWSFTVKKQQIDLTNKNLATPDAWWSSTYEADTTITNNMKSWLYNNGYANKNIKITKINNINLMKPGTGGRANRGAISFEFLVKEIKDANGKLIPQTVVYTDTYASRVRAIIGLRIIKSYLVDKVENTATTISVQGRGDGHGVGLSQWGAKKRADAGQTYQQILDFYYTGTDIVKEYERTPLVSPVVVEPITLDEPTTVVPEPVKDTTAPVIKSITSALDTATNKVKVSVDVSEASKITIYLKDSKGTLITYLSKDKSINAGKQEFLWDVSKINNGTYSLGVIVVDDSGNKASAVSNVVVNKPVPKTVLQTTKVGTVTASTLNVRSKATTASSIVGRVNKGNIVTIVGQSGSWYKIQYGKISGYVSGPYLTNIKTTTKTVSVSTPKPPAPKVVAPAPKTKVGTVTASTLNVRSKATTSSSIVARVQKGNVVTIVGQSGSWYKIQYGKITGYVSGTYLNNIKYNNDTVKASTAVQFKPQTVAPATKTGTVTAYVLNIRQSASTSSKIVGKVTKNKKVTVYSKTGNWYKIKYGNINGYVSGTYLTNVK